MGIFSSEYEYYAFSHTQPLIPDEDKQDTLLTFVASALKHDDENLVGNIIAATRAGLPGRAYNYLTYGRDEYYWGLPESSFQTFNLDTNAILNVIGHDKYIDEIYLPVDAPFIGGLEYLNRQSWFNINEKRITLPITSSWTGDDGYADPFSFGVRLNAARQDWIQIYFPIIWDNPIPFVDPEFYYIDIYYKWASFRKNAFWVIYGNQSQQTDPEPPGWDQNLVWPPIQQYHSWYPSTQFPEQPGSFELADFFPISVFHRDNVNYYSYGEWKTTLRKLTKKLSIDADEVYEEFLNAIRNSKAKEAELVDFCIGFFAKIYGKLTPDTWKEPNQKYAFEFVKELYNGRNPSLDREAYESYLEDLDDWNNWEDPNAPVSPEPGDVYTPRKPRKPTPPQQAIDVHEANGQGFNYRYSYSLIEKYTSNISHDEAESQFIPFSIDSFNGHYGQWFRGVEHISTTSTRYISYMLLNGEAQYIVNTPDGPRAAKPEGGIWCPISYDLLKRLPFRDQEAVLQDGMCGVVYTVLEQEIQWYQQSFWSGVIIIITFVLTVWIGMVGIAGVLKAIGLAALGGVALHIVMLVIRFAMGFLIQLSAGILELGPRGTLILKLISQMAMSEGNLLTTFADFKTFFANLWLNIADFSLDAVSALISKVGQLFSTGNMVMSLINAGTEDDTEDYTQSSRDKREEVEQAYIGNSSRKITDPHLELSRRLDTNMFETPAEYMARTTMVNPGAQVLTIPANYVDMALQLPRTMATGVTVGVQV